jgi:hypothetical protein
MSDRSGKWVVRGDLSSSTEKEREIFYPPLSTMSWLANSHIVASYIPAG